MKKIISFYFYFNITKYFYQKVSTKVLNEYEDTLSSIAHTMMFGKMKKSEKKQTMVSLENFRNTSNIQIHITIHLTH